MNWNGNTVGYVSAGGVRDRGDDVGVGAATADVAAHPLADLGIRSRVALLDTADAGHDLPGRAVAALERVFVDEGLLQRMKPAIALEPLDGGDLRTVMHHRERQARVDALSVHQNRACAARALVAAFLGAGQIRPFPEHVQQRRSVVHRDLAGFAVDAYPHHRGRCGVCLFVFAAAREQRSSRHHTADRYGRTDKSSPVEVDHSAQLGI